MSKVYEMDDQMKIKLTVFDFDGVFTDGMVQIGRDGEIIKSYHIRDGMGIKLLQGEQIRVGVISGFKMNDSQKNICDHLGIQLVECGAKDKLSILRGWCNDLGISLENVAYMGDDVNDIEIMKVVSYSACPSDAHETCQAICNMTSKFKGGSGAIREFAEMIINSGKRLQFQEKSVTFEEKLKSELIYQVDNMPFSHIRSICSQLQVARNIYFCGVGKSGNLARHASDMLKSISICSSYLDPLNAIHGDLGPINQEDIVFCFSKSGHTSELLHVITHLKLRMCTLIGVCCQAGS